MADEAATYWLCRIHRSVSSPIKDFNYMPHLSVKMTLPWRHNGSHGVSNHQPHHCLLNRLFRRRSKKTSKLRVTGLCAGNSPVTGEYPAQMASNAENVSIWWRHHDIKWKCVFYFRKTKNRVKSNRYQMLGTLQSISSNVCFHISYTICRYQIVININDYD